MAGNDEIMQELLVGKGFISPEQADIARNKADADGIPLVEAILGAGFLAEDDLTMLLAAEYGMESFDLSGYKLSPEIKASVPDDIARRYKIVPVMKTGTTLTVAISDPTDLETLDSLRYILKTDVEGVVVSRKQLKDALTRYYGTVEESVDSFLQDITETGITVHTMHEGADADGSAAVDEDARIVRLVALLILEA